MSEMVTRRRVACRLIPALIAILLGGCGKPDNRPPGLRLLMEKRDKLRTDMTVAEVDAVMAGHPRKESKGQRDAGDLLLGGRGSRLTRPSIMCVTYDDKPGSPEWEGYCLEAFFDKEGRLVGAGINEYLN